MATLDGGVNWPLWTNVGLYGVASIVFSIWLTLRVTIWKTGKELHDLTSQTMLFWGLGVNFLNIIGSLAILLGHLIFTRNDGVNISYVQWGIWTITFAILARMLTVFLAHNRAWLDSLFWTFAFAIGSLIVCSFVPDTSRYLWFAVHAVSFLYSIHALWVYRRRSDFHALFILAWINLFWVVGFTLPFLLGSACLQIIDFKAELWWYSVSSWLSQLFVTFYLCYYVNIIGPGQEDWISKRQYKLLSTRTHGQGIPGADMFPHLVAVSETSFLSTTKDKEAQDEALESGRGVRGRTIVSTQTRDLGETTGEEMEGQSDRDEYGMLIQSDSNKRSPPPASSTSHRGGYPHLHSISQPGAKKV